MKSLKLVLVLALTLCAFTLPPTPLRAECPVDCYSHDDCYEICECWTGEPSWWYCAPNSGHYPGSCYCL